MLTIFIHESVDDEESILFFRKAGDIIQDGAFFVTFRVVERRVHVSFRVTSVIQGPLRDRSPGYRQLEDVGSLRQSHE